ncbi:MAG TPA: flagellin [Bryobacteraceae bacterium]|nr:flagellin [Bryobacteraceae bacterium]
MTVRSATIGADWFLTGLADLQARELKTQKELSSGIRVSTAADDPAAAGALLKLGPQLAELQTYQSNLGKVQAEVSAGDSAIGSAINLIQTAQAIAERGATSTATAAERQSFAGQVQTLEQQLVTLADTQVGGRYIFGGDADGTAPYQYNAASANGVNSAGPAVSTQAIVNPDGVTVYQPLTAGAIFDPQSGPNAFGALKNLSDALAANDPAAVGTALSALGDVSDWLNQQQVYYGAAGNRLSAEQTAVGGRITDLQTEISGLRDADVAQDATDLAAESTAQQAALAAQAAIPRKSLFDYLG